MSVTEMKPTLDYGRPSRAAERQKMWWALRLCAAVLLTLIGLLAAAGFGIGLFLELHGRHR